MISTVRKCVDRCYCIGPAFNSDTIYSPIVYGIWFSVKNCKRSPNFKVTVVITQGKTKETYQGIIVEGQTLSAQWIGHATSLDTIKTFRRVEVFVYLKSAVDDAFTLPVQSLYLTCSTADDIFTQGCI